MTIISKYLEYKNRNSEKKFWYSMDVELVSPLTLPELTSEELMLLQKTWPCFKFEKDDVLWPRLYKKENGFDPYYICSSYHGILLERQLSPYSQICSFGNKALADLYFPEISFPQSYIRCINNILYDKEMNKISFDEAVRFLEGKKKFVIKPALGTLQGRGVKRIDLQQIDKVSKEWFKKLFSNATKNFIIQEIAVQHPDIEKLNPTSLNCCRINSIYVGGKYTFGTMLKIGKKGSTVDNWANSYLVGISKEGVLNNIGWDSSLHPVTKTDDGIQFGGIKYPCFDSIASYVEHYHKKYFPQTGIIGWDVFIDANNSPKVIEANLIRPGITAVQLCSGPFFKDVHDELIKQIH